MPVSPWQAAQRPKRAGLIGAAACTDATAPHAITAKQRHRKNRAVRQGGRTMARTGAQKAPSLAAGTSNAGWQADADMPRAQAPPGTIARLIAALLGSYRRFPALPCQVGLPGVKDRAHHPAAIEPPGP